MKALAKSNYTLSVTIEPFDRIDFDTLFSRIKSRYPAIVSEGYCLIDAITTDNRNNIIIEINSGEYSREDRNDEPVAQDDMQSPELSAKKKVINPDYYEWFKKKYGISLIDILSDMPFDLGNAVKYCFRNGLKEEGFDATPEEQAIQDLNKAITYIKHQIEHVLGGTCLYAEK